MALVRWFSESCNKWYAPQVPKNGKNSVQCIYVVNRLAQLKWEGKLFLKKKKKSGVIYAYAIHGQLLKTIHPLIYK